jgi:hypothetical protein
MTTTTLDWHGPLIVGQQLPTFQHEMDLLKRPGVYLWYREYTDRNLLAYVGLSKNIQSITIAICENSERHVSALL